MRIVYTLTHAILQGALTSTLVYFWGFVQTWDIGQAAVSTGGLVMFLMIYGVILNALVYGRIHGTIKVVLLSAMSSVLVTVTFLVYPELGLVLPWYMLLGVLLLSAVIAHILLYSIGKTGGDGNESVYYD